MIYFYIILIIYSYLETQHLSNPGTSTSIYSVFIKKKRTKIAELQAFIFPPNLMSALPQRPHNAPSDSSSCPPATYSANHFNGLTDTSFATPHKYSCQITHTRNPFYRSRDAHCWLRMCNKRAAPKWGSKMAGWSSLCLFGMVVVCSKWWALGTQRIKFHIGRSLGCTFTC